MTPRFPARRIACAATVLALAAALTACGGGGGGSDGTSGSTPSVDSLSVSVASVSLPSVGTASFNTRLAVSDATNTTTYLSFHALPSGSTASLSDSNKFAGGTCGTTFSCASEVTLPCGVTSGGRLQCEVSKDVYGTAVTAGTYRLVVKACTLSYGLGGMNEACDTNETTLTVR